jgi:hypothetical protein
VTDEAYQWEYPVMWSLYAKIFRVGMRAGHLLITDRRLGEGTLARKKDGRTVLVDLPADNLEDRAHE